MTAPFVLDTPDLDQARELVGGLIAPFGLTPCRKAGYRARVRAGRLGALGIAEVSYRGAVDIASAVPDDAHILEIPAAGFCRVPRPGAVADAGPGDVIASGPGRSVRTWMSDNSRLLVIRIPTAVIAPSGDGATGVAAIASPQAWRPARSLAPRRLASVERLAHLVFEEYEAAGALPADTGLALELQRVLIALLSADVADGGGGPPGTQPSAGQALSGPLPRSVRRAQALMIASPDGGLPLGVLALHCGVSLRTLQENFRAFTGQTPTEWWRRYRLDRAHAALRAGRAGTTVTGCALSFGFNHLGRFAEQYRARFGEPPSETLRLADREASGASD